MAGVNDLPLALFRYDGRQMMEVSPVSAVKHKSQLWQVLWSGMRLAVEAAAGTAVAVAVYHAVMTWEQKRTDQRVFGFLQQQGNNLCTPDMIEEGIGKSEQDVFQSLSRLQRQRSVHCYDYMQQLWSARPPIEAVAGEKRGSRANCAVC
jgi:hypothetical protein